MALTTWAVNVGAATVQSDGTFPNTLTATVQGTGISTSFSGDAIYSYTTHVNPVWSTAGCTLCHVGIGTSGLTLSGSSLENYTELVDVQTICHLVIYLDGYRRVSSAGGLNAAKYYSVLLRLTDPNLSQFSDPTDRVGDCGPHSTKLSTTQVEIVRAWIRNMAPNN